MVRKLGVVAILLLFILPAAPTLAGGWVVITVDSLPKEIRAGEPLTLGFMVRQHGQSPTNGVTPMLHARNTATGESIQVEAQQSGKTGHFVAEVVFPGEGQWEWSITASPFLQESQFAPLTVLPESAAENAGSELTAALPLRDTLRWTGLAALVAAAWLALVAARKGEIPDAVATGD